MYTLTDTYRYIGDELYYTIMETAELTDEDENIVHVFAVVGPKSKANSVFSIIENEMIENFQRILSNKRIKANTRKLDSVL